MFTAKHRKVTGLVLAGVCSIFTSVASTHATPIFSDGSSQTPPSPDCALEIAACGCTIRQRGMYTLTADVSVADGLTPEGACLEVRAPNVVLDLNDHSITGPSTPNDYIGIDVAPGSNDDTIVGGATQGHVAFWNIDVLIRANGADISGVAGTNSYLASFKLEHASHNVLREWVATSDVVGLWIESGDDNTVTTGDARFMTYAGIFVGCMGGYENKCIGRASGNTIANDESDWNSRYGVGLGTGAARTVINGVTAFGNGLDDLYDSNPQCGTDVWFRDTFGTASDPCLR
jgi:hypothetical protein